jgi:hypothetical protein
MLQNDMRPLLKLDSSSFTKRIIKIRIRTIRMLLFFNSNKCRLRGGAAGARWWQHFIEKKVKIFFFKFP